MSQPVASQSQGPSQRFSQVQLALRNIVDSLNTEDRHRKDVCPYMGTHMPVKMPYDMLSILVMATEHLQRKYVPEIVRHILSTTAIMHVKFELYSYFSSLYTMYGWSWQYWVLQMISDTDT